MGNKVKENRSIGFFILFKVLSAFSWGMLFMSFFWGIFGLIGYIICGIYNLVYTLFIIFFYRSWIEDVNAICEGDGEHTPGILQYYLLSLVTFGIYVFFWEYSLQNRLKSNGPRYNVVIPDSGSTVLLWDILGELLLGVGPLIALHIMLESTNKLAYAYNQNYGTVSSAMPSAAPQIMSPVTPQEIPLVSPQITPAVTPQAPPAVIPQAPPAIPQVTPPSVSSVTPPQDLLMGQVKCIKGAAAGQGFRLPANTKVVVGKNPSKVTLVINESYVSNVHCTIQYNAGNNTYIVTDHSTNGTFVNGIRLKKEIPMTYPAGTVLMLVNDNIEIKLG